jgi:hypothetical protein
MHRKSCDQGVCAPERAPGLHDRTRPPRPTPIDLMTREIGRRREKLTSASVSGVPPPCSAAAISHIASMIDPDVVRAKVTRGARVR